MQGHGRGIDGAGHRSSRFRALGSKLLQSLIRNSCRQVALVLLVVALAACGGDDGPLVVRGDTTAGPLRERGTLAQARKALGPESSSGLDEHRLCRASWAKRGLELSFFGGPHRACSGADISRAAVVTSGRWRTDRGLKPGDSVERLRQLYPNAPFHETTHAKRRGYWLISYRSGCGLTPSLVAHVRNARVAALRITYRQYCGHGAS